MNDPAPPTGQRFSHYIKRGEPTQDSERMRRRLASLVGDTPDLAEFSRLITSELGVDVPSHNMFADWPEFFRQCALQDVLDAVTVGFRYLEAKKRSGMKNPNAPSTWCRYAKGAIRATFGAAEGLFRLMFSNSPRLTAQEAQHKLEPLLQRSHAADKVATSAAGKLLSAFKDWIDAAHVYRHEAGREEPMQPPLTLAVQVVSVGATFIRSLAELDNAVQQQGG